MTVKEGTLTTEGMTVVIRNENKDAVFGNWYVLENLIDDKWYAMPFVTEEEVVWTSIGYSVNSGGEIEFDENWKWLYGELGIGTYRMIKDFTFDGAHTYKAYYVSVEFNIE